MTDLELTATAMASNGQAVARDEMGKVVFVEGALPGERVRVRLFDERRKFSTGAVVAVLEPSPERVEAPCPQIRRGCGGCQWQHVDLAAQHRLKAGIITDSIRRLGHLDLPECQPTVTLEPWRFRTTLRVGIVDGQASLRRIRSHDLVTVDDCLILHPILAPLIRGPRYHGVEEVTLRCGARSGEVMVATAPAGAGVDLPPGVSRTHFHEHAAGRSWQISTRSFFQTRPDGVDALADLVSQAAAAIGPPASAVDLYSGVGLFAGVLAAGGWEVTAVEGSAVSVGDARANLRGLPVRVLHSDVARWTPTPADLVVADPSRTGLGRPGVEKIAATGARRTILISCDAASLGRDAGLLSAAGYTLTSLTPVDLFPHTFHIEVVAVFDRREYDKA